MKLTSFVTGLLTTGLFVFSFECRAAPRVGPQGGGFRGGLAGRGYGPAARERLGSGAAPVFTGNQNGPATASPYHHRFIARGNRFFSYRNGCLPLTGYAFGTFGLPWVYPYGYDDGDHLYEGPSYGVATVNEGSQGNDLAGTAQPVFVQQFYSQGPLGGASRGGSDRASESDQSRSGLNSGGQPQGAVAEPEGPAVQAGRAMPIPSPAARAQTGTFGELVLLSWHQEDGKATILVENNETNAMQEITTEANKDNLRVVTIHPNANPKLSEVVISNGVEQGVIKFRSDPPSAGTLRQ
ncbi:MAG TPA: hypothetical protein VGD78_11185 [Chthoniobacterales bacterium]